MPTDGQRPGTGSLQPDGTDALFEPENGLDRPQPFQGAFGQQLVDHLVEFGLRIGEAGEIVLVDVDYIMSHDNTTPLAIKAFREIGYNGSCTAEMVPPTPGVVIPRTPGPWSWQTASPTR